MVNTLGLPGEGTGHPSATNHDLVYSYAPAQPHQATLIGDTHVVYDASGNVDRECRGAPGCGANADGLRRFYWTEENRLAAVIDGNGSNVTRFVYDAAGDRVAKLGRGGESLSIGQFFALKGRKAASKHVFAGTTRIATKLSPPRGWQPADPGVIVTPPGEPPSGSLVPGCLPSDYQPSKCPAFPGGDPVVVGPPDTRIRPETYYYHSDHLGSTGWVTDQNARVHEHVEYFPYGQIWRDVRQDADGPGVSGQRFLFTGKELDEETGLYHFGARYYDASRARWLGPDPLFETILSASADPKAANAYVYAGWNPILLKDPTGLAPETAATMGPLTCSPCRVLAPSEIQTMQFQFDLEHIEANMNKPGPLSYLAGDVTMRLADLSVNSDSTSVRALATVAGTVTGALDPEHVETTLFFATVRGGRGAGKPKAIRNPPLSQVKDALQKVFEILGIKKPLPKAEPGLGGAPQRERGKIGYRLDTSGHPRAEPGSAEAGPHINWWNWTGGKRGSGGEKGAVPVPPPPSPKVKK